MQVLAEMDLTQEGLRSKLRQPSQVGWLEGGGHDAA